MLRAEVEDIGRQADHRREVQEESRKRRKGEERWTRPTQLLTGLSREINQRGSAMHVFL